MDHIWNKEVFTTKTWKKKPKHESKSCRMRRINQKTKKTIQMILKNKKKKEKKKMIEK